MDNRRGWLRLLYSTGSRLTAEFSRAVLQLSEAGVLSSIVARWWPAPAECPAPRPAAPPPVTLDTADMAAPLVLLAAAILVTFVLLALEVAADKTIDSGPKYLRQKLLHLKDGRLGAKVDPQLR